MNDEHNLPENWKTKYIPTENALTYVGARRLEELKNNLNQTTDHNDIAILLETIKETILQTHWLPKLVSLVVETGLAVRSPAQKIGRIDIWEDIVILLFHVIHDQLNTIDERSEYFRRIFASLSDFKANSNSKFPTESVLRELAGEYGMDDSDDAGWLPARAAFINAIILDYPFERARAMAHRELIQLARKNHDHATEMRAYISKARLYARETDYRRAIALSQQALVIAVRINAERFYSDIFAEMITGAMMESCKASFVEALFAEWKKLRPHLETNVYESALFHHRRGKYYYDYKTDFHLAAEAFENAYECEKIQQKAVAQATCLLGAGMSQTKMGNYATAQDYYEHALNIHKREGNGEMEIWLRHAIGWNAKLSGDVETGILHLVNALERAQDLPATPNLEWICKGIKEDLDSYRRLP